MAVLEAHMAVGGLFVAINVIVGIWGLLAWRRERPVSGLLSQLLALSHTLAFLQGAFGLYLLAGGYRAPMELHYVYGLLPVRRRTLRLFRPHRRQPPQPVAILDHRLRHRRARHARLHDREGHVTLRDPLWRNLGIVAVVSAAADGRRPGRPRGAGSCS